MRWAFALAVALLAGACGRFGSDEGDDSSKPDGGADAGPSDGGVDSPVATLDGEAGGPNLLPSGSFEGAVGGPCGGSDWTAFKSTSTVVSGGKVGNNACRFCGKGGEGLFTMNSLGITTKPLHGATYTAHAWFKRADPRPVSVELVLRVWPGNESIPGEKYDTQGHPMPVTTDEWIELNATLEIPSIVPDNYVIDTYVSVSDYGNVDTPPCALTDDVEVSRVK